MKEPQYCHQIGGVWYVYDCNLVETYHGPENEIKLSKESDWKTGPYIHLRECMGVENLARMAVDMLNALEEE